MAVTAKRVGIVAYRGAQAAAVLGLRDLLEAASRLHRSEPRLEVVVVDSPPKTAPFTVVVLPPSLSELPPEPDRRLVRWLRAEHARGSILASVCAGAFVLGATGLLDERPATTHWGLGEAFAARHPRVRLELDRLVLDDGDIITAGGLMAWTDLGLRLVDRLLGPTTTLATARHFLLDPGGREQSFYSVFSPLLTHGDDAVLAVQRWLQRRSAEPIDVRRMARVAKLGERTFFRRFHEATGHRPAEYLTWLRVGRAREMLERSACSVEEIAEEVGYRDVGAFRKTFRRRVGLSAAEYRRRFRPDRRTVRDVAKP